MYEDLSQPKTQFIEMLGRQLLRVVTEGGPTPEELARVGLKEDSIVRVNRQGDIELRRPDRWDVIGGLIGEFEERVKQETGLDWV
ncbi:MAG: hypothetical protein ACUVQG_07295 [Thermogutta sp.]